MNYSKKFFLGSPELTNSKFRTCTGIQGRKRRLPRWAWIAIILGSVLLLLSILAVIITFIRKSKKSDSRKIKTPGAEHRAVTDKRKDNFFIIFVLFSFLSL